MKSWLQKNAIEMYSSYNEEKFVTTKRFIRTLKDKIYKYMSSISRNMYIDKLDDIVNKDDSSYHSRIKMKPIDVKSSKYVDSSQEINHKILNLKLVILLVY